MRHLSHSSKVRQAIRKARKLKKRQQQSQADRLMRG